MWIIMHPIQKSLELLNLIFPIEYVFFYLIPVFILLDLIILIWLIYWFYEFIIKNPSKSSNKILRIIIITELLSSVLAAGGYIIMFTDEGSVRVIIGFIFNCVSLLLLITIIIMFVYYLVIRNKANDNIDNNKDEKNELAQ